MKLSKETALYKEDAIKDGLEDAGSKATNYIYNVGQNGMFIHAENTPADPTAQGSRGVQITDSVDIIRDGVSAANFGAQTTARVGYGNTYNISLSPYGIDFNESSNPAFSLEAAEYVEDGHSYDGGGLYKEISILDGDDIIGHATGIVRITGDYITNRNSGDIIIDLSLPYYMLPHGDYNLGSIKIAGHYEGRSNTSYIQLDADRVMVGEYDAAASNNFKSGNIHFTSVASNTYTDQAITFDTPFESTPHVVACLQSSGTAPTLGNVSVSVFNISATGFTIRLFNNRPIGNNYDPINPNVEWIATNL